MHQHNTSVSAQKWYDSGHASLCVLGKYLRQIGFFEPLERRVHLKQKVLKYTPVQKLEMLFVGDFSGIKAVSHTATTVRVDRALTAAFGLPDCAEQSVLADRLDAACEADVADLQAGIAELFGHYSQARQHPFEKDLLVLDIDLSPEPSSRHARSVGARLPGPLALENRPQAGPCAGSGHRRNRVADGDLGAQRRELAEARKKPSRPPSRCWG